MEWVTTTLGQLALLGVSWATLTAGVYAFFEQAEKHSKRSTRNQLSRKLNRSDIRSVTTPVGKSLGDAFTSIFGERILSWRFVLMSVAASVVFGVALLLLWMAMNSEETALIFRRSGFAGLFWLPFFYFWNNNLLVDFLCLLKTRFVLSRLRKSGTLAIVAATTADALVSLVIWSMWLSTPMVVRAYLSWESLGQFLSTVVGLAIYNLSTIGILMWRMTEPHRQVESGFYSTPWEISAWVTLMASVWIWLYVGSVLIVGAGGATQRGWNLLRSHLNIKEKPFGSLGLIAGLFLTVVYLLSALVVIVAI